MTSRILAAAFAMPFLTQPVLAAETLVQIVIDHSGVLHDGVTLLKQRNRPRDRSIGRGQRTGTKRQLSRWIHVVNPPQARFV